MRRYLEQAILKDLPEKVVLLSGPRQCGKTTLSKQLYPDFDYLNWDDVDDRIIFKEKSWDREKTLVIFDELHKMKNWKSWLKGVYDKEGVDPQLLVTGSSKLNTYRKAGDSLAGRHFHFRLHPFDIKEAAAYWQNKPEDSFNTLMTCGGFPEPFLKNSEEYYKRWRRTHLDVILRQDLIDEYAVRDIQAIETLIALLQERVGSTVSYANLAQDLERDAKTIKRWLTMLENLYVIFKVTPYHKNIARSLLKEPKYYFYDNARVVDKNGARLENLVACALLKELNRVTDLTGAKTDLHFLRTKEGTEIDFLVAIDDKPRRAIEVKWADGNLSPAFKHFHKYLSGCEEIQLVRELKREKTYPDGPAIRKVIDYLRNIDLSQV